ncbi:hypothetical protein COT87_03015 [Candidatus Collierbacteria bacterium CG10_big_fil_rev_8_21_14_0_10_44_9]|uniref:UDP-N-acetylmuramate--L-alanine ligase n=1 Tax=Candidatus Collierbacteria bacterium CG10_big_fil_rev_8_21_14_0_10_44_9 TaxID=1974535 RepID=A0A2H0VI65_9BACT|nr:MAG: hypothetical protein COT87_03015 [Candidatus Collierbacteria bacterium CG10_big_fil_rev_8_21_14_0_10_44_9]
MKQAFFIGIKGVGMTALALVMQDAGWSVSGSDTRESFITDDILTKRHLEVDPLSSTIPIKTDLIVYSAAYAPPTTNIKTLSLAEALADFVKDRQVIAVAGVGGKTTTTAMLAVLFHTAGLDAGYYVGTGSISGLEAPGHAGTDSYFVVEADEYAISKTDKRPKFALLTPKILITTNIIHDHPDIYPSEVDTMKAFADLVSSIPPGGTWICNSSDLITTQILREVSSKCQITTYGADHPLYPKLELSVFGDQNKLDALAGVFAAMEVGLTETEALQSIKAYKGAARRQESHGVVQGRLLYDDYGHHPREIKLTVNSFKENFPNRRIILVFESHTYSRTEALLEEFTKSIAIADLSFIMPIFESAREKGQPHTVTTESFASLISGATALTWNNAAQTIWAASKPGDLILTMGAGFVYKLHDEFKKL